MALSLNPKQKAFFAGVRAGFGLGHRLGERGFVPCEIRYLYHANDFKCEF
jgi:hypothetical protein